MFEEKRCSLTRRLVEDLPGEHVYIHCCRRCGREHGPEFVVFHASTGKSNATSPPVLEVPICGGRLGGVGFHISRYFGPLHGFGSAVADV